ncbi:MAG: 50S ribosomal protein L13 [Candidatus Gottesmanbacteria bacterium]
MRTQFTKATKKKELTRAWHVVDVKGKVLGYVATEIAMKLLGKSKPNYTANLDCGDSVVVINCALVEVTGKKEKEKMYGNYSGYPGGLKEKALWQVRKEKPTEIIRHAVWGMLPKNKLRDRLVTRLFLFADENHPYQKNIK